MAKLTLNLESFFVYFSRNGKVNVFINSKIEIWRKPTLKNLPENIRFSIDGKEFKKFRGHFIEI